MAITGLTPGALATSTPTAPKTADEKAQGFGGLKTEDFVRILITELQNQNPLDPMDSNKLLDQITSINNLATNTKLSDTLSNVGLAQNLSAAGGLIGRSVTGKIGDTLVAGVVDKAIVENGQVYLMVQDNKLPLSSVTEINA